MPGTDTAAVVIAVDGKITRFQPGDRVARGSWTGGYAERMIANEWKSVRLPVGIAFETAATVWHNYGTAYYALVEGHERNTVKRWLSLGPQAGLASHHRMPDLGVKLHCEHPSRPSMPINGIGTP